MSALRDALVRAGAVSADAARRVEERQAKHANAPAVSPGRTRREWLATHAKEELLRAPTAATARELIREAHERFNDGTEEFRVWLRPLYELRNELDRTDSGSREQLIHRALRKSGKRFDAGTAGADT